jgi:hypothetical protein
MVPVSSPSGKMSGLVGEWVWPNPANRVRLGFFCWISGRRSSRIFSSKAGSRPMVSSLPRSQGSRKPFIRSRSLGRPRAASC